MLIQNQNLMDSKNKNQSYEYKKQQQQTIARDHCIEMIFTCGQKKQMKFENKMSILMKKSMCQCHKKTQYAKRIFYIISNTFNEIFAAERTCVKGFQYISLEIVN